MPVITWKPTISKRIQACLFSKSSWWATTTNQPPDTYIFSNSKCRPWIGGQPWIKSLISRPFVFRPQMGSYSNNSVSLGCLGISNHLIVIVNQRLHNQQPCSSCMHLFSPYLGQMKWRTNYGRCKSGYLFFLNISHLRWFFIKWTVTSGFLYDF